VGLRLLGRGHGEEDMKYELEHEVVVTIGLWSSHYDPSPEGTGTRSDRERGLPKEGAPEN